MAEAQDLPAWILLFVGLYSLAAAVGELRLPGTWAKMLADFERGPGLRFVTGFFVLSLGAAKAGDTVILTGHRARDHDLLAFKAETVTVNGKTYDVYPQRPKSLKPEA